MNQQKATFAGGCFWCTEAIFQRLKGVTKVLPGYTGGSQPNPTYEQICTGSTGHAESIQITFDPTIIPYRKLLKIFFYLHDPTTKNRQGNDVGTQYRSSIFYHSEEQKQTAESVIEELTKSKYPGGIVTEVVAFEKFYEAENYHKNYYQNNSYQPYCQLIIEPKLQKLLKEYKNEVKETPFR